MIPLKDYITLFAVNEDFEVFENLTKAETISNDFIFALHFIPADNKYSTSFGSAPSRLRTKELRKAFYRQIFSLFGKWLDKNGYETKTCFSSEELLVDGFSPLSDFDSPEQAYAAFRFFIKGYEGK